MPSSTPVTAGDPVKASQYNSLITDMTTIETDMTTLENDVDTTIANLESQTEMLLLNTTVDLRQVQWVDGNGGNRTFYYNYTSNSSIAQSNNFGALNTREESGTTSGVWGGDSYSSANAAKPWVWSMVTTLNTSNTTVVSWGLANGTAAWNAALPLGMVQGISYAYTIFRHTGLDGHLYAVTRASSADTEEATDLGLASSLTAYSGGLFHLKIVKNDFSPTPGVKYYLNGVLVASHLHANSSGNNQYNNYTGGWNMGVLGCNQGATQPASGSTQYTYFMGNMNLAVQTS